MTIFIVFSDHILSVQEITVPLPWVWASFTRVASIVLVSRQTFKRTCIYFGEEMLMSRFLFLVSLFLDFILLSLLMPFSLLPLSARLQFSGLGYMFI